MFFQNHRILSNAIYDYKTLALQVEVLRSVTTSSTVENNRHGEIPPSRRSCIDAFAHTNNAAEKQPAKASKRQPLAPVASQFVGPLAGGLGLYTPK
jgi:hypothetical protein